MGQVDEVIVDELFETSDHCSIWFNIVMDRYRPDSIITSLIAPKPNMKILDRNSLQLKERLESGTFFKVFSQESKTFIFLLE